MKSRRVAIPEPESRVGSLFAGSKSTPWWLHGREADGTTHMLCAVCHKTELARDQRKRHHGICMKCREGMGDVKVKVAGDPAGDPTEQELQEREEAVRVQGTCGDGFD